MNMPTPLRSGPTRPVMGALVACVLLVHLGFLLQVAAPLQVHLSSPQTDTPVQLRLITPPARPEPPPVRVVPPARPRAAPGVGQAVPRETPPPPAEAVVMADAASPPASPPQTEASDAEMVRVPLSGQADLSVSAPASDQQMVLAEPQAAQEPMVVQPSAAQPSAMGWPLISVGALPPSRLMSYQLTGMDKGLTYYASGELRWQHNDRDYEVSLSVRAFLVGSRQWRSKGRIDATGLAPVRFSDSWRNERAAHFDREHQRVVFSSRSQTAPLEWGAQDQVSLYVQLAAAMAGDPERFVPGTRLQVQTATVRDAIPWLLTLEGSETLQLQGQDQQVQKWVCQPRSRYDARVEFWVTPEQAWMPVRIRITQFSGSYIDLIWKDTEPLPALPVLPSSTLVNTPS